MNYPDPRSGMMHPGGMGGPGYGQPGRMAQNEYSGYQQPPQTNYSFLDPIIPTEKQDSFAQNLLKPQKDKITEVYKKLYIGKIPTEIKDNIIERILKA